jgi:hypothetical protein
MCPSEQFFSDRQLIIQMRPIGILLLALVITSGFVISQKPSNPVSVAFYGLVVTLLYTAEYLKLTQGPRKKLSKRQFEMSDLI